jgi:hypothetical protein
MVRLLLVCRGRAMNPVAFLYTHVQDFRMGKINANVDAWTFIYAHTSKYVHLFPYPLTWSLHSGWTLMKAARMVGVSLDDM